MGNRKLTYAELEERILKLEKELDREKETELKFKTVFENSVEGIILIDENGTVSDWNRFIAARTGLSREMAVGNKIWDLQFSLLSDNWKEKYPVSILEHIWLNLITTLANDQTVSKEGQYIGQGGSLVLTEDIIFPMELGEKKFLCIIQRDLTERRNAEIALKKSEENLKQLNATKDKFFSVIAHDLKSPFNTINGFSQLLLNSIRDSDCHTSEKYVETIISSSQNAYRLLNNLLTWASNEIGM
ncbi:MAG: PAS domain S-box protein, partial [Bacteroidia bacterium]|nr:PAS domain S-box protein [Bacteroidia bacterium]